MAAMPTMSRLISRVFYFALFSHHVSGADGDKQWIGSFNLRERGGLSLARAQESVSLDFSRHGSLHARDVDPALLYPTYNLSVPVDHFHNDSMYEPHTNATFPLRYWFDASHYCPGGPVIVLQGGETSGAGRLPFLQKGIVAQLAAATKGLGVILEHRYYGASFPDLPDLSTESMRFLTTDQALADMAYFAKHVVFPGMENQDLTAPGTAWIAYGGSYAGAFVAFLRKLYPDVYWGAISSSGVTEAIYDYWQYFEGARLFAPAGCAEATEKLTHLVDNILIGKKDTDLPARLKQVFGLGNITQDADFASALSSGIYGLQSLNWDPEDTDDSFYRYCGNVSSSELIWPPATTSLDAEVKNLVEAGGYSAELDTMTVQMLNYIGYTKSTTVASWAGSGLSQDTYFTSLNATFFGLDDSSQTWRSWPYQYCTQYVFNPFFFSLLFFSFLFSSLLFSSLLFSFLQIISQIPKLFFEPKS
jgi:hypothetical protein